MRGRWSSVSFLLVGLGLAAVLLLSGVVFVVVETAKVLRKRLSSVNPG